MEDLKNKSASDKFKTMDIDGHRISYVPLPDDYVDIKDTKRGIAADGKNHFDFDVPMSKNEMKHLVKMFEEARIGPSVSGHRLGHMAFFGTSGELDPKTMEEFYRGQEKYTKGFDPYWHDTMTAKFADSKDIHPFAKIYMARNPITEEEYRKKVEEISKYYNAKTLDEGDYFSKNYIRTYEKLWKSIDLFDWDNLHLNMGG